MSQLSFQRFQRVLNDKEIFKDHIFGSSGGNNDNDEDEEAAEAEKATYFQVSPKLLVLEICFKVATI